MYCVFIEIKIDTNLKSEGMLLFSKSWHCNTGATLACEELNLLISSFYFDINSKQLLNSAL
jgi:hypothetical protein